METAILQILTFGILAYIMFVLLPQKITQVFNL